MSRYTPAPATKAGFRLPSARGKRQGNGPNVERAREQHEADRAEAKTIADKIRAAEAEENAKITAMLRSVRDEEQNR